MPTEPSITSVWEAVLLALTAGPFLQRAERMGVGGGGWITPWQEFERLQRMIVSGSLRVEKEAEFKLRCAVLRVFSRETLVDLEAEEEEEAHAEL
jgi:hypothetical protein